MQLLLSGAHSPWVITSKTNLQKRSAWNWSRRPKLTKLWVRLLLEASKVRSRRWLRRLQPRRTVQDLRLWALLVLEAAQLLRLWAEMGMNSTFRRLRWPQRWSKRSETDKMLGSLTLTFWTRRIWPLNRRPFLWLTRSKRNGQKGDPWSTRPSVGRPRIQKRSDPFGTTVWVSTVRPRLEKLPLRSQVEFCLVKRRMEASRRRVICQVRTFWLVFSLEWPGIRSSTSFLPKRAKLCKLCSRNATQFSSASTMKKRRRLRQRKKNLKQNRRRKRRKRRLKWSNSELPSNMQALLKISFPSWGIAPNENFLIQFRPNKKAVWW